MGALIPLFLQLAGMAPTLMRYAHAGEPATAVVEKAIEVAQNVTGTGTPEDAVKALQADPQKVIEFQQHVIDLDAQLTEAYLADRADARRRDVALAQAGIRNNRADAMVLMDVIGLIACLVVLCVYRKDIPGEAVGLLSTIAGGFLLCLRDAHQFEFGSSRGSKDKDDLLAAQISVSTRKT